MHPRSALLLILLSWSCYSLSLVQEPQVLPPGAVRGTAGISGQVGRLPILATGLRAGLFPTGEARLKLSWGFGARALSGLEAGLNLQPYDGERFAVFLLPHYRYYPFLEEDDDQLGDEYFGSERRVQSFALPSLLVVKLPRGHSLFFGPDIHVGTRDGRGFAAWGGHLGLALTPRIARERLSVVPELAFLHTVMGREREVDEDGIGQSLLTVGQTIVEFGLGFSFGARH